MIDKTVLTTNYLVHLFFLSLFFGISTPNQAQNASFFEKIDALPQNAINDIALGNDKQLWVASEQGLINLSFDSLTNDFQSTILLKKGISKLFISPKNEKYLATYQGEIFKENAQGNFQTPLHSLQSTSISTDLKQDKNETLWLSTFGDGLWSLNANGQKTQLTKKNSKLLSDKIYALHIDEEQSKWLATDKGLCKYSAYKKWQKFKFIKQATAICEYQNSLWVAGSNQNGKNVIFQFQDFETWIEIPLPSTLTYGRITGIDFDKQGKLWLTSHVVASFDQKNWQIYDKQNGFASRSALCILLESENVWVGTEGKGLLAKIKNKPAPNPFKTNTNVNINLVDSTQNTLSNLQKTQQAKKDSSKIFKVDFTIPQRLNIEFERSKASLKAAYYSDLDKLAETILKNPTVKIRLLGHTDNVGNPILNMKLSKERAETVKKYLIEKGGLEADKIQVIGYGGSRPVEVNTQEVQRKKNRRVEVLFVQ
jgi:outer membrane protein OmpA-like peptidoglycan-associated protein